MLKLKKLSKEDLNNISDFFLSSLDNNLFNSIDSKEINDLNLDLIINYDNDELKVDLDIGLDLDKLSDFNSEKIQIAIDDSYKELDDFIEKNYY
ncbi:MAG: DUF3194 domain-containing protein [Methanobacteriaceae archaeon]|jgi:hypothetical protein|nr:DUF3194 domain-containing protein [Methanobacteriaceae archaeon]